jgi:ribokinase
MERNGVVVVGSHVQGLFMRVTRFPSADETVAGWDYREALDGGKGSHQAIACARLGVPTHFVGRVGRDRLGEIGAGWMADAGVDLTYLFRSEQKATGCGFVMVNPKGVPAMTTAMGANEELSPQDVDCAKTALATARLALVTFEIPVATALHALHRARELGTSTILTPGPAEPLPPDALSAVDLLIPNEGEAFTLIGQKPSSVSSPEQLGQKLQDYFGLKQVIITLGERGALVMDANKRQMIPAFPVEVADTPGAGDAFTAGVAFALSHGISLVDSARFGCLTAARAVSIRESVPGFGTFSEIEAFAQKNGFEIPAQILRRSQLPAGAGFEFQP